MRSDLSQFDDSQVFTVSLKVTLKASEWNQIVAALTRAPYYLAAPLIGQIVGQAQQQTRRKTNDEK